MKPLTREWLDKAEADLRTVEREQRANPPNYDAAGFHAQQAAEKLKAILSELDIDFRRTHDVAYLAGLLSPRSEQLEQMAEDLERLTALAVEVRYPGFHASAEDAQRAIDIARRVEHIVRDML